MNPCFKVTVTHSAVDTDYENCQFTNINVKRRECNYDVATLTASDPDWNFMLNKAGLFDEIKIYFKTDESLSSYTQVFGGNIRQVNPAVSPAGKVSIILCKGYGVALEDTHCKQDYGLESSQPTLDEINEIAGDIVDNNINKALGLGDNTGYAITKTKIADICNGTSIKYLNNPYRANIEIIDTLCQLSTAIKAGVAAAAHWIVDNNKNLIINTIGAHENTTEWPDWWNTDQAGSTLEEGVDFTDFEMLYKAEEYANRIVLVTDFRRPAYDYWAESHAASWGKSNAHIQTADDTSVKIVGANSLRIETDHASDTGEAFWPSGDDAAWNVDKWGSIKTIPHINFYMQVNSNTQMGASFLTMNTAQGTDFFYLPLNTFSTAENEWVHHSIPIGSYYKSDEENKQYKWLETGSPLWNNINSIGFYYIASGVGDPWHLYIDDLHFNGKIVRSAASAAHIIAYNEIQKVIIARNAMDDSCVAGVGVGKDDGFAARIAYAELLRRMHLPYTTTFTVSGKPSMMAGQKTHLHLCKKPDGTFASSGYPNSGDLRMLTVEHNFSAPSMDFSTTITATNDLLNSFPISVPDQFAMWQENMFLNSNEAKNMRAGAEVDLLIPMLESDY